MKQRNILDADTVKNPVGHCNIGLSGHDAGICKTCHRPSATLINGNCVECMKPCDLREGSCPAPDLGDDETD